MELHFSIQPGVSPLDRGEIEDLVVDALGHGAECLGGGTMLDGSESDFVIELSGLETAEILERCRAVFAEISFSQPTAVTVNIEGEIFALPTSQEAPN